MYQFIDTTLPFDFPDHFDVHHQLYFRRVHLHLAFKFSIGDYLQNSLQSLMCLKYRQILCNLKLSPFHQQILIHDVQPSNAEIFPFLQLLIYFQAAGLIDDRESSLRLLPIMRTLQQILIEINFTDVLVVLQRLFIYNDVIYVPRRRYRRYLYLDVVVRQIELLHGFS